MAGHIPWLPPLLCLACFCCRPSVALAAVPLPTGSALAATSLLLPFLLLAFLTLPGLALFYGGLVRAKNILTTMLLCGVGAALGLLLWLTIGHNRAFTHNAAEPALFHALLAGLTLAILSGAVAERVRFGRFCLLAVAWLACVYGPLAAFLWGKGTLLDPAGGLAVHVAAGAGGLAFAWRRKGQAPAQPLNPSSLALTLAGAGLLLVGWLGLAGAAALVSSLSPVAAVAGTLICALAAALAWLAAEALHHGKPTALGFASGLVAGLVAIAPLTGSASIGVSLLLGGVAGTACYAAVALKRFLPADDPLDVFALHGVGGLVGIVAAGLLQETLSRHLLAAAGTASFSFIVSLLLLRLADRRLGLFATEEERAAGLDRILLGQAGFDLDPELLGDRRRPTAEPKAAEAPPQLGPRFAFQVEGAEEEELRAAWSGLCQAGASPTPEFLAVYPHVTTVEGLRFRFRGGDPLQLQAQFERLLRDQLRTAGVRVRLEREPQRHAA